MTEDNESQETKADTQQVEASAVERLGKRQYRNKYANFDIKPGHDEEVMTNRGVARYSDGEFYKLFRVYGVDWWEPISV